MWNTPTTGFMCYVILLYIHPHYISQYILFKIHSIQNKSFLIRLQFSNFCANLSLLILDLTKSMKKHSLLYILCSLYPCVMCVSTHRSGHMCCTFIDFDLLLSRELYFLLLFVNVTITDLKTKQKKSKLYLTWKNGIYP